MLKLSEVWLRSWGRNNVEGKTKKREKTTVVVKIAKDEKRLVYPLQC